MAEVILFYSEGRAYDTSIGDHTNEGAMVGMLEVATNAVLWRRQFLAAQGGSVSVAESRLLPVPGTTEFILIVSGNRMLRYDYSTHTILWDVDISASTAYDAAYDSVNDAIVTGVGQTPGLKRWDGATGAEITTGNWPWTAPNSAITSGMFVEIDDAGIIYAVPPIPASNEDTTLYRLDSTASVTHSVVPFSAGWTQEFADRVSVIRIDNTTNTGFIHLRRDATNNESSYLTRFNLADLSKYSNNWPIATGDYDNQRMSYLSDSSLNVIGDLLLFYVSYGVSLTRDFVAWRLSTDAEEWRDIAFGASVPILMPRRLTGGQDVFLRTDDLDAFDSTVGTGTVAYTGLPVDLEEAVAPEVAPLSSANMGFYHYVPYDETAWAEVVCQQGAWAKVWPTTTSLLLEFDAQPGGTATSIAQVDVYEDGVLAGGASFNATSGFYEYTVTPTATPKLIEVVARPNTGIYGVTDVVVERVAAGAPGHALAESNWLTGVDDYRLRPLVEDPAAADVYYIRHYLNAPVAEFRVEFFGPDGSNLDTGPDAQTIRFSAARVYGTVGSDPNPTIDLELWEAGAFVSTIATGITLSSETDSVFTRTFSVSGLADPTGADAEIRVISNAGTTDHPQGLVDVLPNIFTTTSGTWSSNYVPYITDDPQSPTGSTIDSTNDGAARIDFNTPTGTPRTGAGLQTIELNIGKDATGGGAPTFTLDLYDGDTLIQNLATNTLAPDSHTLITYTWDAAGLVDPSGVSVNLRISTVGDGGGPNAREVSIEAVRWVADVAAWTEVHSTSEIQALVWDVAYGSAAITGTGTATLGALTASGTATMQPVFSATGTATLGALTASGTGTVAPPEIAGTGTATLPGVTAAGTGTVALPTIDLIDVYAQVFASDGTTPLTDEVLVVTSSQTAGASAYTTFEKNFVIQGSPTLADWQGARLHVRYAYTEQGPDLTFRVTAVQLEGVYEAEGVAQNVADITLPSLTASGTATATPPTFSADGTATLPSLTAAATATAAPPTFTATASVTLGAITATATATATVPTYSADGTATLPSLTASGTSTNVRPTVTATGTATLGPIAATATGTVAVPTFTATGSAVLPSLTATATATAAPPVYTGTGTATLAAIVATGTATATGPLFTGTGTATLPSVTAASTGTVAPPVYTGTASPTLGAITASATATATRPVFTGTGTALLPSLTSSGTATVVGPTVTGTASVTLGAVTAVATGTSTRPVFTATASVTLGSLTVSATGTAAPVFRADAAVTLPSLAASGTATAAAPTFTATGVATLGPISAVATGTTTRPVFTADASATLPSVTASATATATRPVFTATGSATLPSLLGTSDALVTEPVFTGSAAATLAPISATGTATATPPGAGATANVTLPSLTAAGTATTTRPVFTATGTATLPSVSVSATGTSATPARTATANVTLPSLTATASATATPPTFTGDATAILPSLTASGTGTAAEVFRANGAAVLPPLAAAGTASATVPTFDATAAVNLPLIQVSATGSHAKPVYTGTGAATLPSLTAGATADAEPFTALADAAITFPALTVFATATTTRPEFTATGAALLPMLTVNATGAKGIVRPHSLGPPERQLSVGRDDRRYAVGKDDRELRVGHDDRRTIANRKGGTE